MTALSDVMAHAAPVESARMLDGGRWLARGAQRLGGVALVLAAAGMWVLPGAMLEPDVILMKLGVSLAAGFAGLALVQGGRARPAAQVAIDTVRREVRLVSDGADPRVISRTPFADLGRAELAGHLVRLWAEDGALIAEVALTDPAAHRSLLGALRDAGKL